MPAVHYVATGDASNLVTEVNRGAKALDRMEVAGDKATKATKALGSESNKTKTLLEAFKNAAEGVGGKAGESAGQVEKFSKAAGGLATALGPAGLVAGGAAAIFLAVASAGAAAALSTTGLVEEMRKAKRQVTISDVQIAAVQEMDRSIAGLTDDLSRLTTEIGAEFAPALTTIVDGLRAVVENAGTASRVLKGLVSLGLTEVLAGMGDTFEIGGAAAEKAATAARRLRESLGKIGEAGAVEGLVAVRREVDMSKEASASVKALADQAAALRELERIYVDTAAVQLTAEERIRSALTDKLARISELAAAAKDYDTAQAARNAAETEAAMQLAELRDQQAAEYAESIERVRQAQIKQWEDERKAAEAAKRDLDERIAKERDLLNARLGAASQIAGSIAQLAAARVAADNKGSESAKKAALTAFRVQQAAAVAQIAINTAQGIMQGIAQLGPVAGAFAAIGTAATGATQTALVVAQRPPQFDQGGIVAPDHRMVSAAPGEGFLTRSGVQNAGGPDGVQALNQGRSMQQQPQILQLSHRYFRRFVDRRSGPIEERILSAFGPRGQLVGT